MTAPRILFVCLGNICRSPTAEGVARARAAARGLDLVFDSAGTGGWHVGDPPYGPAISAAAERGVDLSNLRARQFQVSDFAEFDLIIAMDRSNRQDIEARRPDGSRTPVRLMSDFGTNLPTDIPDPYYTRDFDGALDLIENAVDGLLSTQTRD